MEFQDKTGYKRKNPEEMLVIDVNHNYLMDSLCFEYDTNATPETKEVRECFRLDQDKRLLFWHNKSPYVVSFDQDSDGKADVMYLGGADVQKFDIKKVIKEVDKYDSFVIQRLQQR